MNIWLVRGAPLGIFILLALLLLQGLFSDPRVRESQLLGKQVPDFVLSDVMDEQKTYNSSIFNGQLTLLNVWGVWCTTCKIELPYLSQLKNAGVVVVGLYYSQDVDASFSLKTRGQLQQDITATLSRYSDPFSFNMLDKDRQLSFDLGVTGAPETFLIGPRGEILTHHIGDLNPRVWRQVFAPHFPPAVNNRLRGDRL